MPDINIKVRNKVAKGEYAVIVCGNSDYVAHFDFDAEWDEYTAKTAHFEWGGKYEDVVFTGNECPVPVVYGVNALTIGVFAGDIRSTTPAFFRCVPCSQDSNSIPADPTPDVYNQLMEMLNKESGVWYPAVDDAGNMSWTRSISETEPQPVNIKGPKGDAGADGIGSPGADGKDGVDGKSAYELAQDNGFQGTMQEWLASLVGADGTNGVDGNDGVSPTVSVAAITGGNRVTITDAEGAKTFDVMDGAQGASGADGKDYVLTDTDKQEIAEAAAGFVDVPSVQPDWNQNGTTAADYIKNRPFYTGDPVETVLVEEQTVAFSDLGGIYGAEDFPVMTEELYNLVVAGRSYNVSWDGVAHEVIAAESGDSVLLGNAALIGSGDDTGEPFVILKLAYFITFTSSTVAEHTISLSGFSYPVTKIDKKYLPELPYLPIINPTCEGLFTLNGAFSLGRATGFSVGGGSFASGTSVTASNTNSHAEGYYTNASGMNAHAEGNYTKASGMNAHAEGIGAEASGKSSHAEGAYTLASSENQHAQGQFNIEDSNGTYAHIVGNGTSTYDRSNAHTLDWSGNAWFAGTVEGKTLILPSSTAGSTKKFKITVDDSGAPTIINESDSTNTWKPTNLPTVTASDAGKFLRVSDTGEWVAETILSASGVSF